MKRYNLGLTSGGDASMAECRDGEWVRYEDHAAALAETRAECERLWAELEDERERCQRNLRYAHEAGDEVDALESRLAAANALLEQWEQQAGGFSPLDLYNDTRAHLAGRGDGAQAAPDLTQPRNRSHRSTERRRSMKHLTRYNVKITCRVARKICTVALIALGLAAVAAQHGFWLVIAGSVVAAAGLFYFVMYT